MRTHIFYFSFQTFECFQSPYCEQVYNLHSGEWEMGLFTPLTMLAFVFSSIHSTVPSAFLKVYCGWDLTSAPGSEGEAACLPSAFLRADTGCSMSMSFIFTSKQTAIAWNLTLWSVLWDLFHWLAISSSELQARVKRDTCTIYFPHFCNINNLRDRYHPDSHLTQEKRWVRERKLLIKDHASCN